MSQTSVKVIKNEVGCRDDTVVSSHVIRDIFRTHFKFTYVIRIIRVQKNSVVENGVAYS